MSKTKIASPVDLKIPENADSSKSFSVDKESVGEASAVKHFSIFHIIL
jgi:hypothetical protein